MGGSAARHNDFWQLLTRLLALLAGGTAELSGPGGARWARLTTQRSLAGTAAGRRCGLTGLEAASFGGSSG